VAIDVVVARRSVTPAVFLYWVSFLAMGSSVSILGPALSELRDRSGSDIGSIGILFVGQAIGYVLGSLAGGRLFDRFDGHRVLAVGLATMAAGLLTVSSFDTLPVLFAVFLVIGVGASGVDVGANAMLLWDLGAESGRSMNVLHLCFGVGALAAPLLVHIGVDTATRVCATACLVCAGAALRVTAPVAREVTEEQDATPSPALLVLPASFFLLYVGLEVGFAGWLPTYAEELRFSDAGVTWLMAVFWIAFTGGRLLASAIAHRYLPRTVLIASCALTVVATGALVVADGRSLPVWIGTAAVGVAVAPQFPVMLSYLERRIHVTGYATSWFIAAAGVGGLVFPWVIGQFIDSWSEAAMPWSVFVLGIATVGSLALTDRRLGGRR
jgi:fucose permease